MAEDKDESQEKTQDPTQRRLERGWESCYIQRDAGFYYSLNRCFIDVFNAAVAR